MTMPSCTSCLDKGWNMVDGKPVACAASCDAGQEWSQQRYSGEGAWESPNSLAPGGEVLAREAARQAAGLPVGALDAGTPVRALLIDDELVQAALEHLAACASELDEDNPARRAAADFVAKLPEQYRATTPQIRPAPRRGKNPAARASTPLAPPSPADAR